MFSYRVTKYNPENRDVKGAYLDNQEWTAISDCVNNSESLKKYLIVEQNYVESVMLTLRYLNIDSLKVENLWKQTYSNKRTAEKEFSQRILSEEMKKQFFQIKDEKEVTKVELVTIIKLILREICWAKLVDKEFEVHFGDDYYMYFVSSKELVKLKYDIEKLGLFIEKISISPYA